MTAGALLTDRYELTMVQAALRDGQASRRCAFEVFGRHLPGRRRYGVVAGLARVVDAVTAFRFDDAELDYLSGSQVVDAATVEFLAGYRFTGSFDAYAEGEAYFPGSPVLSVEGTFADCVVLETVILSILNHDSAIATAAARITGAAGDRPCIEMGSRRTHEQAAVAAARAAYIAGFSATSNLLAGDRYGIPTTGTAAHAFTLLHDDERTAFAAQVAALGVDTTLLVDTYDVEAGIRTAVEVAGPRLGAIRLDSGDLGVLAHSARELLDSLGATGTRITVTSDLDEFAVAALAAAPVDGYGIGTSLVTGSGSPTAGFVYKLVARQLDDGSWEPVEKRSPHKTSVGGRKQATRLIGADGVARAELVRTGSPRSGSATAGYERPLQVAVMREGEPLEVASLAEARARWQSSRAELPVEAMTLLPGDPVIETRTQGGHP